MSPYVQWTNGNKRDDKEHHERASFFRLAEFENGTVYFFLFKKTSSALPMKLVMLFVHVGER